MLRPGVVAGVGVARARRHDQRVVVERQILAAGPGGPDGAALEVEAAHVGEHDRGVRLPAQHAAQRRRDLALGERAGGHLVEQRLEQVMVRPVDEGDGDRCAAEGPGGRQAAEPAADDDDPVGVIRVGSSSSHGRGFYARSLRGP